MTDKFLDILMPLFVIETFIFANIAIILIILHGLGMV